MGSGRSFECDHGDMQAVARHSAIQAGIDVDWQSETLVTVGATEALAAAFMGILNEGDEV